LGQHVEADPDEPVDPGPPGTRRRRPGRRRRARACRDRTRALAGVFAAPAWLRDLGVAAWLLVGVTMLLVGAIWLLSLT
jgi:hypothetical protein